MNNVIRRNIMRVTVRGALELLLHDNADMIDLFKEAGQPDLSQELRVTSFNK